MTIDVGALAARITSECGLEFVGTAGGVAEGTQSFQLRPAHHPPAHTFGLQVIVEWRSVTVAFHPGSFSGELIHAMGQADESGRSTFVSVLQSSVEDGASIKFTLNGRESRFDEPEIWNSRWQGMSLSMRKGMLAINSGDSTADDRLIGTWVSRLSAAILALLPLEQDEAAEQRNPTETVAGLPEGAKIAVVVNRYERDRRNRAAALAIHGHICKACRIDLGNRYGSVAEGLIEVHHTMPVSALGPNYVVDPRKDLVPLCPNCHAVAHRRDPPYSVEELHVLLQITTESTGVSGANPRV